MVADFSSPPLYLRERQCARGLLYEPFYGDLGGRASCARIRGDVEESWEYKKESEREIAAVFIFHHVYV